MHNLGAKTNEPRYFNVIRTIFELGQKKIIANVEKGITKYYFCQMTNLVNIKFTTAFMWIRIINEDDIVYKG